MFCLGQQGEDDQHHRRRDQDAERPARRQRPGAQAAGIAVALHLRQGDLGHGRGGGRSTSRRSTPNTAQPPTEAIASPPRKCPTQAVRGAEDRPAHAGHRGDMAHHHEQRHHGEVVGHQLVDHRPFQVGGQGVPAVEGGIADRADHAHGQGDRHPQGDGDKQGDDHRRGDGDGTHSCSPLERRPFPAQVRKAESTATSPDIAAEATAGTETVHSGKCSNMLWSPYSKQLRHAEGHAPHQHAPHGGERQIPQAVGQILQPLRKPGAEQIDRDMAVLELGVGHEQEGGDATAELDDFEIPGDAAEPHAPLDHRDHDDQRDEQHQASAGDGESPGQTMQEGGRPRKRPRGRPRPPKRRVP